MVRRIWRIWKLEVQSLIQFGFGVVILGFVVVLRISRVLVSLYYDYRLVDAFGWGPEGLGCVSDRLELNLRNQIFQFWFPSSRSRARSRVRERGLAFVKGKLEQARFFTSRS